MASPAAEEWLDRMTQVHNQIHATLRAVNDKRSELGMRRTGANGDRVMGNGARRFQVGDKVLVDWRNLTLRKNTRGMKVARALSDRWIGPYVVVKDKWDGHAYELDIPAMTHIHKVIYVSLLKPYHTRSAPPLATPVDLVLGQPDLQDVDTPDNIQYRVEKFVDSRWFPSGVKYQVRWLCYKAAADTWQTVEESGWPATLALLAGYRAFHDANPRKAADSRVLEAIASMEVYVAM